MNRGIFITIEGPEGAGKTSVISMLAEELTARGSKVMMTREPGGIAISEQIREVILSRKNTMMDGRTEALLYAAARSQHLIEKIIPALKEGAIVLCDRFIDSSLVYQGYARGLGIEEVYQVNKFAIGDTMPDLTLLFDLPPEMGLARISSHAEREVNRLDLEELQFHQKVREGYLLLAEKHQERIVTINAEETVNDVYEKSLAYIVKRIGLTRQ